ncbi:MAG: C4-type zinc ribbon domain-containing protein [Deinococcota bacterium]|jgi:predicted  nucleic acid-binding Zn-ribbon protein|nr:C4-type zinc ribbon domain-containing protein [Deinococcota bacterium]
MLDKLSQVQTFDLDLDSLEHKKQLTPEELSQTRRRKEELAADLARVRQAYSEVRQQVNSNELEISSLSERRKTAANAASAAMTTKEASQYQNQELQLATRLEEVETDTLPLIERMETLEGQMHSLETELAELEPELAAMLEKEKARVAALDEEQAVIAGNRDAIARELDPGLLRQYEQVRRSRRGLGLVPIIDNKRCGGCNMQLPLHVLQKANSSKAITRCPSCGRILWSKGADGGY